MPEKSMLQGNLWSSPWIFIFCAKWNWPVGLGNILEFLCVRANGR